MEKLEKRIINDLVECINRANNYAEQNAIKDNSFSLGQVDAFISVLEGMGHNVYYEYTRKKQYRLNGTHRFEIVEKVTLDNEVIFTKGA